MVPHQLIQSPILFKKLLKPSPRLTRDSQKPEGSLYRDMNLPSLYGTLMMLIICCCYGSCIKMSAYKFWRGWLMSSNGQTK
ncbi:hypothetical protein GBA52_020480 [Prunus armeniaca]|nr:hypothetical protein GBA52_020480 [Prunus armeniaca]